MKKLLLGCFLAANAFMLTSCLDSGNGESSGAVLGVVQTDYKTSFRDLFYYSYYAFPLYFSNFSSSMIPGDCYYASVTIKEEDNPDPNSAGFQVATITAYEKIDKYQAYSVISDTSVINKGGEMAATAVEYGNYIKGCLFLASTHEEVGDKQENSYSLSYDYNQEPETDSNNRNVYNLFYRVTKIKDGSSPYTTKGRINAFDLGSYFDSVVAAKEKAKGKDRFYFKINYIKSFNSDTTAATWGASDVFEYPIFEDYSNL